MPEAGLWYWQWHVQVLTGTQVGVKGNFAEWHDHLHMRQKLDLSKKIGLAVLDFLALRFIRWGRTVERLGDKTIVELQTVVAVRGRGLIGKTMRVQCPVEPFSAAVSGEGTASTVAAMGCGRQTEH